MIKFSWIKINLLFLPLCVVMYLILGPMFALGYLCAIFLHEVFHVLMARALGFKDTYVVLSYYGCKGEIAGLDCCEMSSELPIAAAGPLFSLVCAVLFSLLSQVLYFWYYPIMGFAAANLVLGCFNLLPALPLDGGRILRSLVCAVLPREKGTRLCVNISIAIGIAFIAAFLYFAFYRQYKVFLVVIGLFIILGARSELRNLCKYRVGIMEHLDKLQARPRRIRRVAVSFEDDLKSAVSMFKDDCFNVVDVVTKDGKINRTLTEIELIKELTK